jgi:hypothetical protein
MEKLEIWIRYPFSFTIPLKPHGRSNPKRTERSATRYKVQVGAVSFNRKPGKTEKNDGLKQNRGYGLLHKITHYMSGKGSKRRTENYRAVSDHCDEIQWVDKNLLDIKPTKGRQYTSLVETSKAVTFKITSVTLVESKTGPDILLVSLDIPPTFPQKKFDPYFRIETEAGYGAQWCEENLGIKPTVVER